MCVSIFSTTFVQKTSHSKKNLADMVINVKKSSCKVPVVLVGYNETLLFSTDLRKNSNIKFNQNPSRGSRVIPCGRTKLTVAFRNFANAPKHFVFNIRTFSSSSARKKSPVSSCSGNNIPYPVAPSITRLASSRIPSLRLPK